jgi:hypothetical protein
MRAVMILTDCKTYPQPIWACPACKKAEPDVFYCKNGEYDKIIGCCECITPEGYNDIAKEFERPNEW